MAHAQSDDGLGDLHPDGDGIEHGHAGQPRELDVIPAEPGAGEDDDFGPVFGDDLADLLLELAQRLLAVDRALFHVDVDRPDRRALCLEAVVPHQVLLVGNELLEHGQRREAMAEHAGQRHRGFRDRDDRNRQRFLHRIDADATEAGQHDRVRRVHGHRFERRADHEGARQVIAERGVDVARAALGGDADQLGARRGGSPGRFHDLGGHGLGAVRVDDENLHPRILRHSRWACSGNRGSSRSTSRTTASGPAPASSCSMSQAS